MEYKSYPKEKDTNRKNRKGMRREVFVHNKKLASKKRKEKKDKIKKLLSQ